MSNIEVHRQAVLIRSYDIGFIDQIWDTSALSPLMFVLLGQLLDSKVTSGFANMPEQNLMNSVWYLSSWYRCNADQLHASLSP
jgi:hypothetical protein